MPRFARAAVVAVFAVIGTGCAEPAADTAEDAEPVKLSSCGQNLSISGIPERVVTLDQSSTETMIAMGLADHMVGTANLKTEISPEYQDAYDDIPVLSSEVLTSEQLLAANPDLVVASFGELFTTDRAGTRHELAELGLPTFVSALDCPQDNGELEPFDRLFQDYEDLGSIFDVSDEADDLVAQQQSVITKADELSETLSGDPSVMWLYSAINGVPYVAGKGSMPSDMSRLAGVSNAFDDVDELWPEVSWEEIADRDPDVIIVGDIPKRGAPGDTADEKRQIMAEHPVASQLSAVRGDRIIEVPGIEMDPSVRSINTLGLLIDGLEELGYAG